PEAHRRGVIIDRLDPALCLLSRIFQRRTYRGHPITWMGTGAASVGVLVLLGLTVRSPERPFPEPGPLSGEMLQTVKQSLPPTPKLAPLGAGAPGKPPRFPMTMFIPDNENDTEF
ncbi:MAG: hypothetical protein ACRCZF_17185, partial [Gemmataceae bacterium]